MKTKLFAIICAFIGLTLISGVSHAQMTGNSDGTYAGESRDSHNPANPHTGAYYDWGRGRDGTGYCYQFTNEGYVLNGGANVPESFCEAVEPSKADWARGKNGYGYCYQFTPDHLVMYQGRPQSNATCEKVSPSHFAWDRAMDGWTYCFQFTPYNAIMNDGHSVPNEKCY